MGGCGLNIEMKKLRWVEIGRWGLGNEVGDGSKLGFFSKATEMKKGM